MKKRRIRRYALVLAAAMVLSAVLSGCAKEVDDGTVTLRVVTEASQLDTLEFLNQSILNWKFKFEAEHENVSIQIEQLPKSGEERSLMMERIRAELMAGKGPDVVLLPASSTWDLAGHRQMLGSPLIIDVNQAMNNGIFYDISEF